MAKIEPLKGCEVLPPLATPKEAARKQATPVEGQDRQRESRAAQGERKAKSRRQPGRRFPMLNTFVDCTLATILRTDALVWLVLFRDARGDTAKSAQAYIARRAGLGKRTVGMAIGRLERAGLLDVLHRGGLNRGLSIYRIRPLAQADNRRKAIAP